MTGPWYRYYWPEDGLPSIVMGYPSREEAERDFPSPPTDEDDDSWPTEGALTEADMLNVEPFRDALAAFRQEEVDLLKRMHSVFQEERYDLEEAVLRELLMNWHPPDE